MYHIDRYERSVLTTKSVWVILHEFITQQQPHETVSCGCTSALIVFFIYHLLYNLRMGLVISKYESVNTNIKNVLTECGLVDSMGDVSGLPKDILDTVQDFGSALLESFELQHKAIVAVEIAKSAEKMSTIVNGRIMQIVLCFWKDKFPDKPIPREVKQQMQRLACLVLSYLFL